MVYTSAHLSLALLEIIVAADQSDLPVDYVYAEVDIPDNVIVEKVATNGLPAKWYSVPAPTELREIGDDWIKTGSAVALIVPSAITRIEENILLNPGHADFSHLSIGKTQLLPLDPRFSAGLERK